MSFSVSTPALSRSVRVCRSLVWIQAALSILTGAFVVLVTLLFGSGGSIPFAGGALTGAGAVALGAGYIAAGVVVAWLGAELGRPARWVPALLAGAEVLLTALALLRSFDLSIGTVLNVALAVAIVAILAAGYGVLSTPRRH